MTRSMTGYGVSNTELNQFRIQAEVKSLNSKFLDISIRLPKVFLDKELEVRRLIGGLLERGKVTMSIDCQTNGGSNRSAITINEDLFSAYYNKLSDLCKKVEATSPDIFKLALQSPEVMVVKEDQEDWQESWPQVLSLLKDAIERCSTQQQKEGKVLERELSEYVGKIRQLLKKIQEHDPIRMQNIRERLQKKINDLQLDEGYDVNRFEQELIYYVEKLDIEEEKVRLKSHLDYFEEVLLVDKAKGKKLGFVSQEIGREINTIGSKANDATVQRLVVNMKEELEKIKEQVLNIL